MDSFVWFKFNPSRWLTGRISDEDKIVQQKYFRLCCKYWIQWGEVTHREAELILGVEPCADLIEKELLLTENGQIVIKFLRAQIEENEARRAQASRAGKASAERRVNVASTSRQPAVNNTSTDKSRVDKSRVDKRESISARGAELEPRQLVESIQGYESYQLGALRAKADGVDLAAESLTWAAWLISEGKAQRMSDGQLAAHFLKWMNNAKNRGGRMRGTGTKLGEAMDILNEDK